MTRPTLHSSCRARGFTLVEVLVVMSLLSLIMLALGSALRTTAQTEERVDQRLLKADELRTAGDFLRAVLGRLSAQKLPEPLAAGQNPYVFRGAAQELQWVGIMPARHGVGGRHHFRLALEGSGAAQALVLRFAPWVPSEPAVDWNRTESYVLVAQATALAFQYEDASTEPPTWVRQWESPDSLPQHVQVSVGTPAGAWPVLAVALRVMPGTDPRAAGGAVFGGSR